jgi:hypothetical protein
MSAGDATGIARKLAEHIDQLAREILPNGHREGAEYRCGSVAGEAGSSLGVHLAGNKRGIWGDFAAGIGGDALDLVRAVLGLDMPGALAWSRRWLGLERGEVAIPRRPAPPGKPEPEADPMRWQGPWSRARPTVGSLAEIYLAGRRLHYDDPEGQALRFHPRRARRAPDSEVIETRPALLALLRDVRSGAPIGIINIFLCADGSDRLRDKKGKTVTGRATGAAVMLSDFADVTYGLTIAEGVETSIALLMADLAPVWSCGGAGVLATFPVLGGIESVTIAGDADPAGRKAAASCATRWREAGRLARIIAPPAGDWADAA